MTEWQIAGLVLGVFALGVLIGAGLGYYAASTDLAAEPRKAFARGFREGVAAAKASTVDAFGARLAARPGWKDDAWNMHDGTGHTAVLPDDEQEHA